MRKVKPNELCDKCSNFVIFDFNMDFKTAGTILADIYHLDLTLPANVIKYGSNLSMLETNVKREGGCPSCISILKNAQ